MTRAEAEEVEWTLLYVVNDHYSTLAAFVRRYYPKGAPSYDWVPQRMLELRTDLCVKLDALNAHRQRVEDEGVTQ